MQQIFIAIGDPVTAEGIQTILFALAVPSILTGMELTAPTSDQIAVSPGSALTDSGVIISETEIKLLGPPQYTLQTVQPKNYTILYQYTPSNNFGGNPAVLVLQDGLIPPSSFQNGIILGWLKYPGASVALTNSMFVSAKRVKVDEDIEQQPGVFLSRYAPFSPLLTRVSTTGPFPTVSESYDGGTFSPLTTIQNTGGSLSTSVYILPFQISPFGLGKISVEMAISSQASCTVTLMKKDGTSVQPIGNNFFTNQGMSNIVLTFDQANNFSPGQVCYIHFLMTIQPTNTVTFRSIGTSADTEPF